MIHLISKATAVTNSFRSVVSLLVVLLSATYPAYSDESLASVKDKLQKQLTDLKITGIRKSPVQGLYEITYGTRTALVSSDGRYIIQGDLIDLQERRNLTAESRAALILSAVNAVSESDMIVIGPAKSKRMLTVFTDVDCPYCARLHQEVPKLNQAGVKVRYLLYPRAGKESETYKRSVAVWCAKDRIQAVGIAKSGGKVEMKTCPNPIDRNLQLGAEVGVEGTPTIILDDGRVLPGYAPADRLLAAMGISNAETPAAKQ